jgi:hypothetical protein
VAEEHDVSALPDLDIKFTTVLLGGTFSAARMCGSCAALVPLAASEIPDGAMTPEQAHAAFHSALVHLLSDPNGQRQLAAALRERTEETET